MNQEQRNNNRKATKRLMDQLEDERAEPIAAQYNVPWLDHTLKLLRRERMGTGIEEEALPDSWVDITSQLPRGQGLHPETRAFQCGALRAMVGCEPMRRESKVFDRWHLSVSRPDRLPTWEEIQRARDELHVPPDVWLMMVTPPKEYWYNVHENCLHLWEFHDPVAVAHFKRTSIEWDSKTKTPKGRSYE